MNTSMIDATTAQFVANMIRKQLGIMGLAVVGASKLRYFREGRGSLAFDARLHFEGQSRVRVMNVEIALNSADLYDITITRPDFSKIVFANDVYATDLAEAMSNLDLQGVAKA